MAPSRFFQAQSVSFAYEGQFEPLFKELRFQVSISGSEPARIGLIGPNGQGKSTLLGLIAGRFDPAEGEIRRPKGLSIGMLEQDPLARYGDVTLHAFITSPFHPLLKIRDELHALEASFADEGQPPADRLQRYGDLQQQFMALGGYPEYFTSSKYVRCEARRMKDV
ncbi:ATP-binding cassette domain-containing protein [bacterium]|nr:ATP-binding cassette domain-containing protein [bacterium]